MAANLHPYPIVVTWQGGRDGTGTLEAVNSGTKGVLAVPPEFMGPGGATNPEELLTSAVTGCYSITLGIITSNRKLPVVNIRTEAVGTVEQNGASFVYTKVLIKPTITLSADATDVQIEQATDLAHKADAYCSVTHAIRGKVEVSIEPSVVKE